MSRRTKEIKAFFNEAKSELTPISQAISTDLDCLFEIALANNLFPGKNNDVENIDQKAILKWVQDFVNGRRLLPSKKIAEPKKTCDDPAVEILILRYWDTKKHRIRFADLQSVHNLFMSAENNLGELLEEYIAENIEPLGFIWCVNKTLRSVDFCDRKGIIFIQVKNKDNTENSSSSKVREGTQICKWNRLKTARSDGKPVPKFNWEKLNSIIGQYTSGRCNLSEDGFQSFLEQVYSRNPKIITHE